MRAALLLFKYKKTILKWTDPIWRPHMAYGNRPHMAIGFSPEWTKLRTVLYFFTSRGIFQKLSFQNFKAGSLKSV